MGRSFFYGTDAEMVTASQNFANKITSTPTVYGLTAAQATAYATLNTDYADAYEVAKHPDSRTRGSVAAKNDAKKKLREMASDLAKIIEATPTVTDQQKIDLGLRVRANPTPNPRPTVRPGMDIVVVNNRTVTTHIHDSASSTKRGKPAGVVAAWFYSFIGAEYPSDPTLWSFEGATTKSTFDFVFPTTVAGGTQVWLCAAWVNAKQEAGPTSVPISTNLQGGGTNAASMKIAA